MPIRHAITLFAALTLTSVLASDASKRSAKSKSYAAEKTALANLNSLIGGWRGVGQPRRNSTRGAWIETAEWVWEFQGGRPAIRYNVTKGKYLKSVRITFDSAAKGFVLDADFADSSKRTYQGKLTKDKLIAVAKTDKTGYQHRLTVTKLNEKRTLVLFERRQNKDGQYFRLAGVGYTRKGTSLAIAGAGEPECVVTGGKGTMKVSYKGKTYYVCCSGCREAFKDDPVGILADYRKRLAKRKKNR